MKNQTYKLDFGSDEKLYSTYFKGEIPPDAIRKMLESTRNCLYKTMAENIRSYLEQHHLKYSDFVAKELPLNHNTIMRYTDNLLHSASCIMIDKHIGDADIYYGILDCQQWNEDNCHEGCYSVVKRIISESETLYRYKILAQTFHYDKIDDEEQSYFAIRINNDSRNFRNIDAVSGESVIATFGCVDMMGLLLDIDSIISSEQAKKLAMK